MAYTRDPCALLRLPWAPHPPCSLPTPLVSYRDVVLKRPVGRWPVGAEVPVLEVDWRSGVARAYADREDAANGVPDEVAHEAWPYCEPLPPEAYVAEAVAYLARGHSLAEPACRCAHGLGEVRSIQLGILAARAAPCLLPRAPVRRTAAEVSHELALHDVLQTCGGCVLRALRSCPAVVVEVRPPTGGAGGAVLFSSAEQQISLPRCAAELRRAIFASTALVYALPPPPDRYVGMETDAAALVAEGAAHALPGADGAELLARRTPSLELAPDPLVRALWHAHAPAPALRLRRLAASGGPAPSRRRRKRPRPS